MSNTINSKFTTTTTTTTTTTVSNDQTAAISSNPLTASLQASLSALDAMSNSLSAMQNFAQSLPALPQSLPDAAMNMMNSLDSTFMDTKTLVDMESAQAALMLGNCGGPPQPQGQLTTDDKGVVTTPGGYTIKSDEKFGWKITGPDGKEFKVWGDPHANAEGNGHDFQFKDNTTFALPDGTRINCSTTPYGNGATVTKGLEILNGNSRVNIDGIDQGPGKTSQVFNDGIDHINDFGGAKVLTEGSSVDQWAYKGKEVVGSSDEGSTLQLGDDISTIPETVGQNNGSNPWAQEIAQDLGRLFGDLLNPPHNNWMNPSGSNLFQQNPDFFNQNSFQSDMMSAVFSMGEMFGEVLAQRGLNGAANRPNNMFSP